MLSRAQIRDALRTLLRTQSRSLTAYLGSAFPFVPPGDEHLAHALQGVIRGQQEMARRLTVAAEDLRLAVDAGEFSMDYSALNDLSIRYVVQQCQAALTADLQTLAITAESLRHAPPLDVLAEEAVGETRAHLEALAEAAAQPTAPNKASLPTVSVSAPRPAP